MRILRVHNFYQQPGGEDQSFAAEVNLLRRRGHQVLEYTVHNDQITRMNRLELVARTFWNKESYWSVRRLIREHQIQVVHCDNTFPLVSPALNYAAKTEGAVIVWTLHNYRLFCPNGLLFRNGHVCEDCLGQILAWRGAVRACYRGSSLASSVTACMLAWHRLLGTWQERVDVYIALNQFCRNKFIEGGLQEDKIKIKPTFLPADPGYSDEPGKFALFVGRLSPEKGLSTLLLAWQSLDGVPLKIVGDGPLMEQLRAHLVERSMNAVELLGFRGRQEILGIMKAARFLVFPSTWYECSPLTITEAFACGVPVLASHLGAMANMIDHGHTGLHFAVGDPEDLAEKALWAWMHPRQMAEMGRQAREEYERNYTAERNYEILRDIYGTALISA